MTTTSVQAPVPVYRPCLGPEIQEEVRAVLEAEWLGMGMDRLSQDFELGLKRYLFLDGEGGGRRAASTNSCTGVLHIAGPAHRAGPGRRGDRAVVHVCRRSPGDLADRCRGRLLRRRAGAPQPRPRPDRRSDHRPHQGDRAVDYLGLPCYLDEIVDLARAHGLRVIEDAAHDFGSVSNGRPVGSFGDIICFSFGPVKMITTVEGGAVITPDAADVPMLHELRHLGIDSDTDARYKNQRTWDFDVVRQDYRCHLGSVPSAMGLAQLDLVDTFIANRQDYCRHYETGIRFLGAHEFPFYAGCRRDDLRVTREVTEQVVTLPLHPFMPSETLDRVVGAVRSFIGAGP